MLKTLKLISIILFFFSLFPVVSSQADSTDSIRIVTYYPSPFGTYRELRTKRLAIGDDYIKTGSPPDKYDWQEYAADPMHNIGYDADLVVQGNAAFGTTKLLPNGQVQIASINVPLLFTETDQTGRGSLWRMPLDSKHLRFDVSINGVDFGSSSADFATPLDLYSDGNVVLSGHGGGNVGIGTDNPQAKLDVNGGIRVGPDSDCNSNKAGTMRYNSGMQFCDGTDWQAIGGGWVHSGQIVFQGYHSVGSFGTSDSNYQDLDLSSFIGGAKHALVFLQFEGASGNMIYGVKPAGVGNANYANTAQTSGPQVTATDSSKGFLITETSSDGKIRWATNAGTSKQITITLRGYI